jgi:hypothetical protein
MNINAAAGVALGSGTVILCCTSEFMDDFGLRRQEQKKLSVSHRRTIFDYTDNFMIIAVNRSPSRPGTSAHCALRTTGVDVKRT